MKLFVLVVILFSTSCTARPKNRDLIDMTYLYNKDTLAYPLFRGFKIDKLHKGPNDELSTHWLQYEDFSTSTHTGTHMDAPAHLVKGAITIDKVPLRSFFGPAAVIDITSKAAKDPDAVATLDDVRNWEDQSGQTLDDAIVLLYSGWGQYWNNRTAYFGSPGNDTSKLHFPGFSNEACQWMVENRNIKGVGSDTASIDPGYSSSSPCHGHVLGKSLFILENVANVDKLPVFGAKLRVFPMKIDGGSAAPVRIVASVAKSNDPEL